MPENNQSTRAQKRESVDPEERIRPMPLLPAVIAIGMVLFGVIYIAVSGPYSRPWMGDERTLADLQAKRLREAWLASDLRLDAAALLAGRNAPRAGSANGRTVSSAWLAQGARRSTSWSTKLAK